MQFSHLTVFLVCFIQLEAGAAREQAREAERQTVEARRLQREREVEAAEGAAQLLEEYDASNFAWASHVLITSRAAREQKLTELEAIAPPSSV